MKALDFASLLTAENLMNWILYLAKPIVLLIICKIVINMILKVVATTLGKTHLDKGIQSFGKSAIKIGLWAISIIMVAGAFGVDTASMVAIVGVASLALSLSVQGIFTNVFSGIVILMTKPFVVGDYVDVCGVSGVVKSIELMRTTINTLDNKVELIPNGDINASRITNYSTEQMRRVDLNFTASYDNSTESVKEAIMEVIKADKRIFTDGGYAPFIALSKYNANDIEYVVRMWVKNADYWDVYFSVNEKVRESYKKHGIQFSYPHVVVHTTDK